MACQILFMLRFSLVRPLMYLCFAFFQLQVVLCFYGLMWLDWSHSKDPGKFPYFRVYNPNSSSKLLLLCNLTYSQATVIITPSSLEDLYLAYHIYLILEGNVLVLLKFHCRLRSHVLGSKVWFQASPCPIFILCFLSSCLWALPILEISHWKIMETCCDSPKTLSFNKIGNNHTRIRQNWNILHNRPQ